MRQVRPAKQNYLIFEVGFSACLVVIIFFTYRSGIIDLPRADQIHFLQEQEVSSGNLDFFLKALSYNRSSLIAQGDFFLFRPGFFGYLALVSIFLRENLYISGLLSLSVHTLAAFAFYRLLLRITFRSLAGLFALMFAIQYPGMEMFLWRHISPYMIGLICFIFGLLVITKESNDSKSFRQLWIGGSLFFASSLFHESFVFSLFVTGIVFFLYFNRKLSVVMLTVALVWMILNIGSFIFYHPNTIFGSDASSEHLTISSMIRNLLFLNGLFAWVSFWPASVDLRYELPELGRASFDVANIPAQLLAGVGLLVLILLVWLTFSSLKSLKSKRYQQRTALIMAVLIYFVVLLCGFGIGRVTVRTLEYLRVATYYYYLFHFCMLFLAVVFLSMITSKYKQFIMTALLMAAVCYLSVTYSKIQKVLQPQSASNQLVSKTVWNIHATLKSHPSYCYGGSIGESFNQKIAGTIIFEQNCTQKKNALPLYALSESGSSKLILGSIERPDSVPESIVIDFARMASQKDLMLQIDSSYEPNGYEDGLLSEDLFNPIEISVEMKRLSSGGIVFAYQSPRSFLALYGYRAELFVAMNKLGIPWSRWYPDQLISRDDYFRLIVRKFNDGRLVIFCNERAIQAFSSGDLLEGKIGLYENGDDRLADMFKNLTVTPSAARSGGQFYLKSVLEISLA